MSTKVICALVAFCMLAASQAANTPASETQALQNFYVSLNGSTWTYRFIWNQGDPCGGAGVLPWYGITCVNDTALVSHISVINLVGNNLRGSLPNSVLNLPHLTTLALGSNAITGKIPIEWTGLTSLTYLDLSQNRLLGSLQPLAKLNIQSLFLYGNSFTGTLVPLSLMPSLVHVSVRNNFLAGTIPQTWASALTIQTLIVQNNSLTGSVPQSFSDFPSLSTVTVAFNFLTGYMPLIPQLTSYYITGNFFQCPVPVFYGSAAGGCYCQYGASGQTGYCVSCPAGTFNALGTSAPCTPCPDGTYAPVIGSQACTVCSWPSYTSSDGIECRSAASLVSAILSALVVLVFCLVGLVQCCKAFCSLQKKYDGNEDIKYSGDLRERL